MIDGNRQTGRTYRMIQEAIYHARLGHQVIITAATRHELQNLEHMYRGLDGPLLATNVHFITDFDLETKLAGFSTNSLLFRDHHAVEASEAELTAKVAKLERENQTMRKNLNTLKVFVDELFDLP